MNREQIEAYIEERFPDCELLLADGMDAAFVGVAERFEPDGHHRLFAVYDYDRMVKIVAGPRASEQRWEEAAEYVYFNIAGAYVGETTPAILYRPEKGP